MSVDNNIILAVNKYFLSDKTTIAINMTRVNNFTVGNSRYGNWSRDIAILNINTGVKTFETFGSNRRIGWGDICSKKFFGNAGFKFGNRGNENWGGGGNRSRNDLGNKPTSLTLVRVPPLKKGGNKKAKNYDCKKDIFDDDLLSQIGKLS
jgi:hypothetical protein